ncbi:MAG: uracil-DNA glycosylase [Clostridiales bacterium]
MKINCVRCIYFYITWDVKNQRGCKYHGFKSQKPPSMVVYESSGDNCVAYTLKEKKYKKKK